jgi:hypothetical protein
MSGMREERKRIWKRAIREAIKVLSEGDGFANLDCSILNLKKFAELVQRCLIEAVGEVQDEGLSQISRAAIALLEDKLERLDRDR